MNRRRKLIVALGAGAASLPLRSFAQQQGKTWRVGFLSARHVNLVESDYYYGPLRQGMREFGYVEGKNLLIEWRSAGGSNEKLPDLATELVNLKVDVIVTGGTPAAKAVQKATSTIPVVMGAVSDPVGSGLVQSLARPAGNITGMSSMGDVRLKHLEMLLAMVPQLSRVAVLVNPSNTDNFKSLEMVEAAGPKFGVKILGTEARTPQEIENAFSLIPRQSAGGLIVLLDTFFFQQVRQIAELTAKYRLPAIAGDRLYAEAGVLMSYGASLAGQFRHLSSYVDKIFKGAKPADLPVEQPTVFESMINRKTAKALGLKIPESLLISADKVIE